MRQRLIFTALFLTLCWPGIVSAQTDKTNDKLEFNRHGYIPFFSLGSSEDNIQDDKFTFQFMGAGYTFLEFKRIRTLGIEGNVMMKSYINRHDKPANDERETYLGVGLITPLINYRLSPKYSKDDMEITFRIGMGYGFFQDRKPVKVLLLGITIGS